MNDWRHPKYPTSGFEFGVYDSASDLIASIPTGQTVAEAGAVRVEDVISIESNYVIESRRCAFPYPVDVPATRTADMQTDGAINGSIRLCHTVHQNVVWPVCG